MRVQAITKNINMSAQKMREVVRQIQGLPALQAQATLAVVSRNTAFHFKGKSVEVGQVATTATGAAARSRACPAVTGRWLPPCSSRSGRKTANTR